MSALPHTHGERPIRSRAGAFIAAFAKRIGTGLLPGRIPGQRSSRSRYAITERSGVSMRFTASDWPTALAVGLNDVEMTASDGRARYEIRYGRWAAYVVTLGAAIGLALIALFLVLDMREYIERHPGSRIPGLTIGQNLAIAWAMAVFWGFIWPWILIAIYPGPLRRLMDRIIDEVDREAEGGVTGGRS